MKQSLNLPEPFDGFIWRYADRVNHPFEHRHDELESNLVLQGTAVYLLKDRRYELGRGSLVWFFPDQEHVLLEHTPDFAMWIVVFRRSLLERVCTSGETGTLLRTNPEGHFCRRIAEGQLRRLHRLHAEMRSAERDPARYNAGLGYLLLSAWEIHLAASEEPLATEIHPSVEKAVRLMRDETGGGRLAGLARRAGLSPSHLSRAFKKQTGLPLSEFRNRCRLDRFLTLFGEGRDKQVMRAALEAGFGSYPQFHRVFTRLMGCSPADYRRQVRGGEGE
ncbi:MAG: helix-turn-helix transcriptional regulator [Verrucomicrobiae bacterium]|nr:helix-turn-helix transcriptional regulator [Verrucomicrobiae bacterium]